MMTLQKLRHKLRNGLHKGAFFVRLLTLPDQRAYARRWLRSQERGYLLKRASPWITFSAIDFLDERLSAMPSARVFEYGSGGSTLYWLKKGATCVSVEHDAAWYAIVWEKLAGAVGVDLRFIEADNERVSSLDPANPNDYASADAHYHDRQFKQYVQQIDAFPDETFDFILIDGRARPACLAHSLSKVRVGGYIILDNSDREYYTSSIDLSTFKEYPFEGVSPGNASLSRTSLYQRKG